MLINLSNHPSNKWDEKQINSAIAQYGIILDIAFPAIKPEASHTEIKHLAKEYFNRITAIIDKCANEPKPNAVHIQGEFTFVFNLVSMLKSSGIICVASTAIRNVQELSDGKKIVTFNFVQFRKY